MPQPTNTTRRQFLATATAASAVSITAPYFVPKSAFGANDRIVTGHVGVKNQGTSNLKGFVKNAAAVCDVDVFAVE